MTRSIFDTYREMAAENPAAAGKFRLEHDRAICASALKQHRALMATPGQEVAASMFAQLHAQVLGRGEAFEQDVGRLAAVERLSQIEKLGLTELARYEVLKADNPIAASIYRDTRSKAIDAQASAFALYEEKLTAPRQVADPLLGVADAIGPQ